MQQYRKEIQLLFDKEDYIGTVKKVKEALTHGGDPNDAKLLLVGGRAAKLARKFDDAILMLIQLVEIDSSIMAPLVLLSEIYEEMQDFNKLHDIKIKQLALALEKGNHQKHLELLLELREIQLRHGFERHAMDTLQTLAQLDHDQQQQRKTMLDLQFRFFFPEFSDHIISNWIYEYCIISEENSLRFLMLFFAHATQIDVCHDLCIRIVTTKQPVQCHSTTYAAWDFLFMYRLDFLQACTSENDCAAKELDALFAQQKIIDLVIESSVETTPSWIASSLRWRIETYLADHFLNSNQISLARAFCDSAAAVHKTTKETFSNEFVALPKQTRHYEKSLVFGASVGKPTKEDELAMERDAKCERLSETYSSIATMLASTSARLWICRVRVTTEFVVQGKTFGRSKSLKIAQRCIAEASESLESLRSCAHWSSFDPTMTILEIQALGLAALLELVPQEGIHPDIVTYASSLRASTNPWYQLAVHLADMYQASTNITQAEDTVRALLESLDGVGTAYDIRNGYALLASFLLDRKIACNPTYADKIFRVGSAASSNPSDPLLQLVCVVKVHSTAPKASALIPAHIAIKGRMLCSIGNTDQSRVLLLKAVQCDDTLSSAFECLGTTYLEQDTVKARKCFEKALQLNPLCTVAIPQVAKMYLEQKAFSELKTIVQQAISKYTTLQLAGTLMIPFSDMYRECWMLLGRTSMMLSQFEDAISAFHKVLTITPDTVAALLLLGESLQALHRMTAALRTFVDALSRSLSPADSAYVHFRVGSIYAVMHQGKKACKHLRIAHQMDPDAVVVQNHLAVALLDFAREQVQQARITVAMLLLREALSVLANAPAMKSILELRGRVFELLRTISDDPSERTKSYTECVRQYCKMTQMEPWNAIPWTRLAQVHIKEYQTLVIHRADKEAEKTFHVARRVCESTVSIDPRRSSAWSIFGSLLTMSCANQPANSPHAMHCLIRAVQLDPDNGTAWVNLGLLFYLQDVPKASQKALTFVPMTAHATSVWSLRSILNNHEFASATCAMEGCPDGISSESEYAACLQYCEAFLRNHETDWGMFRAVVQRCLTWSRGVSGFVLSYIGGLACLHQGFHERALAFFQEGCVTSSEQNTIRMLCTVYAVACGARLTFFGNLECYPKPLVQALCEALVRHRYWDTLHDTIAQLKGVDAYTFDLQLYRFAAAPSAVTRQELWEKTRTTHDMDRFVDMCDQLECLEWIRDIPVEDWPVLPSASVLHKVAQHVTLLHVFQAPWIAGTWLAMSNTRKGVLAARCSHNARLVDVHVTRVAGYDEVSHLLRYDQGLDLARKLLARNPYDMNVRYVFGIAALVRGQRQNEQAYIQIAERNFQFLLEHGFDQPVQQFRMYELLCECYRSLRRREPWEEMVQNMKNSATDATNAARCAWQQAQWCDNQSDAINLYMKALESQPQDVCWIDSLITFLEQSGSNAQDIRPYYEQAIRTVVDDDAVLYFHVRYALFLVKQGYLKEGLKRLKKQPQAQSDNQELALLIGWLYLVAGDTKAANAMLEPLTSKHEIARSLMKQVKCT